MALSPLYLALLRVYHYFPLHSPVTLWLVNGAWGRFSAQGEKEGWYLDGNKAWAAMEVVSPLTFITTVLFNCDVSQLSTGSKIAISMYLLHYSIRSIISPLILAPQRAPQHASVTLSAMGFNLMNGYIMGGWLAEDPGRGLGERLGGWSWVAVAGWAVGLAGNVYHDEILHSLRGRALIFDALPFLRPYKNVPADTGKTQVHVKQDDKEDDNKSSRGKVYEIPQGGLFYWVTFPNYLCEWFEWTCYAILTSPSFAFRSPAPAELISQAQKRQYPELVVDLVRILGRLPVFPFTTSSSQGQQGRGETLLLSPPWMFLVALLAAMIPRAINGQRWYEQTFRARWRESGRERGRWVCLPGVL